MKKQMRYSPEIRERAVRLLHEHQKDYESQWATIFSGGNGVIYGVQNDGTLYWYRHKGWLKGENNWVSLNGKKIGDGWIFDQIFSGSDGLIYGVHNDGTLHWYRHKGWLSGAALPTITQPYDAYTP